MRIKYSIILTHIILTFSQKNKINEVLNKIKNQLSVFTDGDKTYFQKIKNIFIQEENWEKWKEDSCPAYEKTPKQEDINNIELLREQITNKYNNQNTYIKNEPAKTIYKNESANQLDFNNLQKYLVNTTTEMSKIKVNFEYNEVNM